MGQLSKVGQLGSPSIVTLTIWGLPHDPRPIRYQPFPWSFVTPPFEVLPTDIS